MASLGKCRRTTGLLRDTRRVLYSELLHVRSRLPTLWSSSHLVASVGRLSETTIRRYIAEQTMRPEEGRP